MEVRVHLDAKLARYSCLLAEYRKVVLLEVADGEFPLPFYANASFQDIAMLKTMEGRRYRM